MAGSGFSSWGLHSFLRTEPHLGDFVFFSLERDITLSIGQAKEREEFYQIISEKEDTLRSLELEAAKLVRSPLGKDHHRGPFPLFLHSFSQGTIMCSSLLHL